MTGGQVEPPTAKVSDLGSPDRLPALRRESARLEAEATREVARADADWLLERIHETCLTADARVAMPAGGRARLLTGLAAAQREFELDLDLEPLIRAVRGDLTSLLDGPRAAGDAAAVAECLSALSRAPAEPGGATADLGRRAATRLTTPQGPAAPWTTPNGCPVDLPRIIAWLLALSDLVSACGVGREAGLRALGALLAAQAPSGAWENTRGEACAHATGSALSVVACSAALRAGEFVAEAALASERGIVWLLEHQERSGAWRHGSVSAEGGHPRATHRPPRSAGEGWIGLGDVAATRAAVHGGMRSITARVGSSFDGGPGAERAGIERSIEAGLAWWLAARGEHGWPRAVGEPGDCHETAAALELLVTLVHWRAEATAHLEVVP